VTDNYKWLVHVNEGFSATVKAPTVEAALMQAFAIYWEKHPQPSSPNFDIQVINMTLYKENSAADNIK
jgi:hypothetical protein